MRRIHVSDPAADVGLGQGSLESELIFSPSRRDCMLVTLINSLR